MASPSPSHDPTQHPPWGQATDDSPLAAALLALTPAREPDTRQPPAAGPAASEAAVDPGAIHRETAAPGAIQRETAAPGAVEPGAMRRGPRRAVEDEGGAEVAALEKKLGGEGARQAGTLAWGLSLLLHLMGLGGGAAVVARVASEHREAPAPVATAPAPVQLEGAIEIELPTMSEMTALVARGASSASAAVVPGGEAVPRPDQRPGRGGGEASQQALNLADQDDAILLSKDLLSTLDRSQLQRLKTADDRASQDDRRATWNPMELTFLASGAGARQERRAVAEADPSQGARSPSSPSVLGGNPGGRPQAPGEGEAPRQAGNASPGSERAAPGQGVANGAPGRDLRASADVAFARPSVSEGRPAVPATAVDRPRDNVDSDQEVASAVQSLLHASTAGGKPGEGPGGSAGPGRPGSGGEAGPGSASKAAGNGAGSSAEGGQSDAKVGAYTRGVFGKVQSVWGAAFPREQAIEGRQGIAIVDFTILADGRVVGVTLTRTSGIPEFDDIARRAVMRSGPFGPLPSVFGASKLFRVSLDAKNPILR